MLHSLLLPKAPKKAKFDEVVAVLQKHCAVKKSVVGWLQIFTTLFQVYIRNTSTDPKEASFKIASQHSDNPNQQLQGLGQFKARTAKVSRMQKKLSAPKAQRCRFL